MSEAKLERKGANSPISDKKSRNSPEQYSSTVHVNDYPGDRSDYRHGDPGAGVIARSLQGRPPLRRLARTDPAAEIDRRAAEARFHFKDGRANLAAAADHRRKRRGQQPVIRGAPAGSWLAQMLARKPKMLVIVALANKSARVVWALLTSGEDYRAPAMAA